MGDRATPDAAFGLRPNRAESPEPKPSEPEEANAEEEEYRDLENAIFSIKRLMGRKHRDHEVQRDIKVLPFKIAGPEVLRIINEPTAAALAYGWTRRATRQSPSLTLVEHLSGQNWEFMSRTVSAKHPVWVT